MSSELEESGEQETAFLDLPYQPNLETVSDKIAIVGVTGATLYDPANPVCTGGPFALRRILTGHKRAIDERAINQNIHFDVSHSQTLYSNAVECGNVGCTRAARADNRREIRASVGTLLNNHAVPSILSGEDSVPVPFFEAFEGDSNIIIVQIDAHIDRCDELNGERVGLSSNMRRASEMPQVKEIVQIGYRGIGSAKHSDYADAKAWGADLIPYRTLCESGMDTLDECRPFCRCRCLGSEYHARRERSFARRFRLLGYSLYH